jgi:tryptophan-rich sensory protein
MPVKIFFLLNMAEVLTYLQGPDHHRVWHPFSSFVIVTKILSSLYILLLDPFQLLLTCIFVGLVTASLCLCFGVGTVMVVAFKLFSV